MITIKVEKLKDCKQDLLAISEEYFNEVWQGWEEAPKYAPSEDTINGLELLDSVHVVCMRNGTKLIGYTVLLLTAELTSMHTKLSTSIFLYVQKQYRGRNSLRLINEAEVIAKELGADFHAWSVEPANDFSRYIIKHGYRLKETLYTKRL